MNGALLELLEAERRIRSRGYSPKHLMRLFRLLTKGDKGASVKRGYRKNICTKDYKWVDEVYEYKRQKDVKGPRGYCVACGAELRKTFICQECGEDNQYADWLGLTEKKKK